MIQRKKTADFVVDDVIDKLLSGELRSGDRIDINALADDLGLSRAPVREGLVILERDGLVTLPLHKGAFVSTFDESVVGEAFDLYGLLSSVASEAVARNRTAEQLAELARFHDAVLAATEPSDFELEARTFRRRINYLGGGERLRSLLRTFTALIPAASRISVATETARERDMITAEYEAIAAGDPGAAAAAILEHIRFLKANALDELRGRGVI